MPLKYHHSTAIYSCQVSMNLIPEFLMEFPKLCLREVLRDVKFWPDSWAKKSIWYMDFPIKTIITAKSIILS